MDEFTVMQAIFYSADTVFFVVVLVNTLHTLRVL